MNTPSLSASLAVMGDKPPAPPVICRRLARRQAYRNGALWALGSGLVSSTLVVYLAIELGTAGAGLGIGMILAAPQIAGLLRLAAPGLIRRVGQRKRFCQAAYLMSVIVLALLPASIAAGRLLTPAVGLAALVATWCIYHLLEYLATVALWAWLGDLVPLRIRGRFLGRRERWMVTGQAVGMLAAGLLTTTVGRVWPEAPRWLAYVVSAEAGVIFLGLALVPLAGMPDPKERTEAVAGKPRTRSALLTPLADPRFRRLIYFGCWFSFFNGLTQSAQYMYPARVLAISLGFMLVLKMGMRVGQLAISPSMGRLADRLGNRPVMLVTLPIVAAGPLFYFLATPDRWYWIVGGWVAWIAYAGINVCLPNLMLKLAPTDDKASYIASFHAISGLSTAASTLLGGILLDRFLDFELAIPGGGQLDFYQCSFLFGWLSRTMGVLLLLGIRERPAEPKHAAGPGR
ncbi:MAG: MFS transporter [Thermoguttaceae bacterium]